MGRLCLFLVRDFGVDLFQLQLILIFFFFFSVFTNGSDKFVLRNASVQLMISKGRITSLLDVKLGYVSRRWLWSVSC